MPRYVAFLRAINVGGRTVRMDRLRELFALCGYSKIDTVIASGNVLFESTGRKTSSLEQTIESTLGRELGFAVETFIRTPAEIAAVVNHRPFPAESVDDVGNTLYVGFLATPAVPEAVEKVMRLRSAVDDLNLEGRELYWLRRSGAGESLMSGGVIEKALGAKTTIRNATTVRKIAAKLG